MFALVASITGGIFLLNHVNPLHLIASPLPVKEEALGLFLVTGVLIAPAAEELLFRGVLYAYLRRFNLPFALISSTLIFAGFHYTGSGLPLVQAIGGVVFALAFERSKSLAAPFIIHSLGNLAIFSISILVSLYA
jgi:membrane protease YdiL (CAAX protease family)